MSPKHKTKGEKTRLRLREAAIKVFSQNGYHLTKVSDIVSEAGLTQPTFYLYYDSKEAAYDALVSDFRKNLQEVTTSNLIEAGISGDKLEQRIALSFQRFLDFMERERPLTEIGFFQPPGCSVTKNLLVEWVAENIAMEQANGVFSRDVRAEDAGRMLVGMLDQFGRLRLDVKERSEIASICARLFWRGTRC